MQEYATARWAIFQSALMEATHSRRFSLDAQAQTALHLGNGRLPAGYIDISDLIRDKGLGFIPGNRIAVPSGSNLHQEVVLALWALPRDVGLEAIFITGGSHALARAAAALLQSGVVKEAHVAGLCEAHFQRSGRTEPDMVSHLVAALGVEIVEDDDSSLVTLAQRFTLLESIGCSPAREDRHGLTAAHHAAAHGNTAALRALDSMDIDICAPNSAGLTPLHWAAANCNPVGVRALIAYLKYKRQDGAAQGNEVASLSGWLSQAALNRADRNGRTPLHLALSHHGGDPCASAIVQTADALRAAGARIEARDDNGNTPLQLAALCGTGEHIRAMHQMGFLESAKQHGALFDLAQSSGNRATAIMLLRFMDDPRQHSAVLRAARSGSQALSELLVLRDINLNAPDARGRTPMQTLVGALRAYTPDGAEQAQSMWPHFQAVMRLAREGADLDGGTRAQLTHAALQYEQGRDAGQTSVLRKLFARGLLSATDADLIRQVKERLLVLIHQHGLRALMRERVIHGLQRALEAGITLPPAELPQLIQQCADRGQVDVLQVLKRAGVSLDIPGPQGLSCLQQAIRDGNHAAMRALLDAGADVNRVSDNATTALDLARQRNNTTLVTLLKSRGATAPNPQAPERKQGLLSRLFSRAGQ